MSHFLSAVCPAETTCKCCGGPAPLYGVVDFHKHCIAKRRKVLDLAGVPIYYYRCATCQFLFTTAFDSFSREDFRHHIYNSLYPALDPDYELVRPKNNAALLVRKFTTRKPERLLDYGGGNGFLGEALRTAGFPSVTTYDPFVDAHAAKPTERFDLIVSFEVVEHSTDPVKTFAEMNELLAEPGLILFSTLLQPANFEKLGLSWWYAGPRNGHVSLFTRPSLQAIGTRFGLTRKSFNDNLHVFYRNLPEFAKEFISPKPKGSVPA